MSTDPTDPLEIARRENRALAERVSELERQLKRFASEPLLAAPLGRALPEREALLSEVERLAHMGSWVWDVETNEVWWSDGMYRVLGYDPASTRASFDGFFARIHPDDLARVRASSERSIASGVNERVECRVLHPQGNLRHMILDAALLYDGSGRLRRAVGAAIDVTEQRASAQVVRRTAELLSEAQRIGKMGSFEVNLHEGRIHWSDELYRILDLDPTTPPSTELFVQRLHEDDREHIGFLVERSKQTGQTERSRARIVHRDGSVHYVDMMAHTERDPSGTVLSIRGTVADVTELVRLEAQFHQSQKMEAVGQLAGGLAHDFNNLLMVITGNVELLLAQQDSAELREILEATSVATSLTARLLAFTRQTAQRARVVALGEDLELAKKLIERALGDRIVMRIEPARDLWPVCVDSGEIQQVLLNLALNARDAMPDGGTFTLRARNQFVGDTDAERRNERAGDYVALSVEDSGVGMDEATCARAFEPFFTTKTQGRGTGLGLPMVFGSMKRCGGFVELRSRAGEGTTITLFFPRAQLPASAQPSAEPKPGVAKYSALLVEDNPAVAHVTRLILVSLGYEVRVTHDPQAALRLWEQRRADVLVTDVEMPGMSGVRLRALLAERDPELRTVFITGHSHEQLATQPRSIALMKPFRRAELQQALNALRRS